VAAAQVTEFAPADAVEYATRRCKVRARSVFFWLIPLYVLLAGAAQAAEVAIVQPAHEETIHSNQGKLTVKLQRTGAPGARVKIVLDGAPLKQTYRTDVIELTGIERGSHTLQAVLLDAKGEQLAASQPVSFYMWQASRLFPSRQ
jgi:hypothetical protein